MLCQYTSRKHVCHIFLQVGETTARPSVDLDRVVNINALWWITVYFGYPNVVNQIALSSDVGPDISNRSFDTCKDMKIEFLNQFNYSYVTLKQ